MKYDIDKQYLIDSFERIAPNHPLLMYGKMKYYNHSNDFDSAYNVSKKLGKMKYNSSYILQLAYCDPKPKKVYKELQKLIKNSDYDFLFARANYYGDYGLKINRIDYDKFIKDSEHSDSNCVDSLVTKILLDRGDIDNALKVVTRGVERFNNDLDNCTCIVGYYIYMMIAAIQMIQMIRQEDTLLISLRMGGIIAAAIAMLFVYVEEGANLVRIRREINIREAYIIEEVSKGNHELTLPTLRSEFESKYSMAHLCDISDDEDNWNNELYKNVYLFYGLTVVPWDEWEEIVGIKAE